MIELIDVFEFTESTELNGFAECTELAGFTELTESMPLARMIDSDQPAGQIPESPRPHTHPLIKKPSPTSSFKLIQLIQ